MSEVIAKCGKKGATFFVRYHPAHDLKSSKILDNEKAGAIDVLLGGKMTVLPPSIHPDTARPYTWRGKSLVEADLAALPELTPRKLELLKLIIRSEYAAIVAAGESTHDAGVALAAQLVAFGCDDDEIEALFQALLPQDYDGNSLKELPGWLRSARAKGFDRPSLKPAKPTNTDLLIARLATDGVTLSHDPLKQAYMTVPQPGGGSLHYRLGSKAASEILAHRHYLATRQGMRDSTLRDVQSLLTARAVFEGAKEEFYIRVARHDDSVVIDLGTDDGSVVVITPDGFRVQSVSPVNFMRSAGSLPLPRPIAGFALDEFKRLLGLKNETFTLVLAFILNCLRPAGPYMFLLVEGEQGSGKSVLCTILRRLIDPNLADKLRLPELDRDLMILANELFLLSFDNTSGMSSDISDMLCSISTGGGFVTRKLYTDGDVHIMKAVRPFIINGISDIAGRPDLLERAIPIQLERMPDDDRMTEGKMFQQFEAIVPGVLGALYAMVACALRNEATTEPPKNIRMADAAHWLKAAEPATGLLPGAFIKALENSQADRIIARTNNEPVVIAIRGCLNVAPFEGTIDELRAAITPLHSRPRFFPETAIKLSKDLDRLKTGMALAGVYFQRRGKGNRGQRIRVWLEGQEHLQSKPPMGPDGKPPY